ncbi:Kexstatin-1 precursor [Streptomyces sp. ADI96-02]|uniref:subtilase-type protease inhibitor n=1 Tax=unclassified Streptomyces TaxID=2593676 RepID=UPI000F55433B|nr:subtilase-type protease inhibitor [Streptomyces sp. ADI96-02]RPK54692.1 Kexstatin-1 precursor [Streptomyces sp. ADI96-02]
MHRNTHAIFTTLTAGALLLGGLATATASAHAAPAKPQSLYAPSALVLTVARGEDPLTATVERAVTLTCAPRAEGSHPAAAAACKELKAVDGQFNRLMDAPSTKTCTRQWDPVSLTAHGVWQGKRVDFAATYGNPCEMQGSVDNSTVFAF